MSAPALATPFQDSQAIDFFATVLDGPIGSGAQTITLASVKNSEATPVTIPTTGYLLIDPNNSGGLKELVRYNNLNVGAKTVDLPAGGRGLMGTTDQAHLTGVTVWLIVSAGYYNDLVRQLQDTTVGHHHDGVDSRLLGHAVGKSADQSPATSTLVADSELVVAVKSGETWAFEGDLNIVANVNPVISGIGLYGVAVNGSTNLQTLTLVRPNTASEFLTYVFSGAVNTLISTVILMSVSSNTSNIIHYFAVATFTADGNVAMSYNFGASATVKKGSTMFAQRIA